MRQFAPHRVTHATGQGLGYTGLMHNSLFDRHYLDLLHSAATAAEPEPEQRRAVVGADIGIEDTRRLLARHNNYLCRYAPDGTRTSQAAWLVGMAGCTANAEHAPALLEQAVQMGLSVEGLAELGLVNNSRACAHFLTRHGVDWNALRVSADLDKESRSSQSANEPSRALLEHVIDPETSAFNHKIHVNMVPVLRAAVLVALPPVGFVEALLESGQVAIDARNTSMAAGLKSGQAYWVSEFIANGSYKMALACLSASQPVPQAVLDEALLVLAQQSDQFHMHEAERDINRLSDVLRAAGANPDARFELSYAAMEKLLGQSIRQEQPCFATAREWAVWGALQGKMTVPMEKALFRSPWPAPPEGSSWLDFTLERHAKMIDKQGERTTPRILRRLMEIRGMPALPELLDQLAPHLHRQAQRHEFAILDALLASKQGKSAEGSLDASIVLPLLVQYGSVGDPSESQSIERNLFNWWDTDRVEKLARWLPVDQAQALVQRVEHLRQSMGNYMDAAGNRQSNAQAIVLEFSSFLADITAQRQPSLRTRRTL